MVPSFSWIVLDSSMSYQMPHCLYYCLFISLERLNETGERTITCCGSINARWSPLQGKIYRISTAEICLPFMCLYHWMHVGIGFVYTQAELPCISLVFMVCADDVPKLILLGSSFMHKKYIYND
jgi:hypothetical protein